ncbi:methylmalonyl-CoA mutase subunit beta [Neobacillus niacini]|uniref:methylmalonyl-CoA mutase subunit beta n=1 Tax=Neobacillus niacini TaxID=86668 RepID=UPI003983C518
MDQFRNQSFPLKTKEDWKAKAEESLKGRSIDTLKSITYENIVLKPLYSEQDVQETPDFPGGADFRRGINPLGYVTNEWKAAQRISYRTLDELKEKLHDAASKGQTAISFEISEALIETKDTLNEVLGELPSRFPFALNGKGHRPALLGYFSEDEGRADQVSGYIASDPLALFAESGFIAGDFFKGWIDETKMANLKLPKLRTVLVDTSTYHQGGANAVQELGIAAATGTFYLQKLLEGGMKLDEILSKMIFQFSIGGNFFMELAKIRAARILWGKITKVYGADDKDRGMHITAETSLYTKTVYDRHVNLLRAGNEGFAAVIGGVQYLHITPFDSLTVSTPLSERIARNTQNILKEEAYLQKVVDPAGGSWYVEALTNELAEKAWKFFQEIEAKGGMLEVLTTGWLQDEISAVNEKRKHDVYIRKQSIVGTNVYASLDESAPLSNEHSPSGYLVQDPSYREIKAISKTRLSEPFEKLRKISEKLEGKSGHKPKVGMICLGELKQYKPRLDFMKGFLAAGGLQAVESTPEQSFEQAKQFILSQNTKYFCICSSNDQYESEGHNILSALKKEFPDTLFYLAGLPEKDVQKQWIDEGVEQFIHLNSNCYETLASILSAMEVTVDEVTKA